MLVIGRRLPTVSGSQAMLSRTAPYHVGRRVLSSSSGLQEVLRGALHGLARPACTARAAGVVCVVLEALDRSAGSRLRGHEKSAVCAGCNGCSLPLCGTWLRRSASPRAREPGVHAHLLDLCLCGLRLHVEDIPRLRLHHTAPYHRLLRRSTHLATVCTQQEHRA